MADAQQGDRTEKPTARRLKDALERGQIARSRDLSASLSLAGATLMLGWYGLRMITFVSERMALGLSTLETHARMNVEPTSLAALMWSDAGLLAKTVGPPAVLAGVASVAVSVAQGGFSYSPKAIGLHWDRLSPKKGIQKFAPSHSGPDLAKAVFGVAAIGAVSYLFVLEFVQQAPRLMSMTPVDSAIFGWNRIWTLLWRASLTLAVLAAGDYVVQRWRWFSDLKMSRQEVRDESKLQEGSPEIKARVRRVQRDMARRRMLHAMKTATVVVTNPTHFAVALAYRREEMNAPVVVAKGQDEMAARIRAIARQHGVPIVENVTLARSLFQSADIGDTIPASLFGAVAEVLAYLVRLKQLTL